MAELDYEKIFKLQMAGMKLMQCHPDTKIDMYWAINIFIIMGPYTMYFILLIHSMKFYIVRNDFFNAFRNGVPISFYICMTSYLYLLTTHRQTIGNLIRSLKNDYTKTCFMDSKSKSIVLDYAIKAKNIMNLWALLMFASLIVFMLKSVVLSIYHTHKDGELKLIPYHEMHYPLNITEQRKHSKVAFAATFFGEMFFTTISALAYMCTVPLGPIFILHACGQLELIKIKFEDIFEKENVEEHLKEIVQNLQYVYNFVQRVNECFTTSYEILLKQTTLVLPCTAYAIIQSIRHNEFTVEYVSILMASFLTSSIPCYYGDLLIQKSEEVRFVAYSSGWENVNMPRARKTLLIILTRSCRTVAIKSIFCTICLDTLSNVYKQAYTTFNLMSAMWN